MHNTIDNSTMRSPGLTETVEHYFRGAAAFFLGFCIGACSQL